MKKKLLSVLLTGALAISLMACGNSSDNTTTSDTTTNTENSSSESDLEYIKNKGTLVVGITDFEPMDYKDSDGNWIGFDADLASAFAESLGVDIEFVEIDWDNKVLEINSKTVDCIWNGMTLSSEVTSALDCSNAYLNNSQIVIVASADADKYQDIESLSNLTFAVESGSAGAIAATENNLNSTEVTSQAAALMEVAAKTSDAAIIDSLMAAAMVGEGTGYADLTYTVSLSDEEYGVGFRKGSDIVDELNKFLVSAYNDGTITSLADKYGVSAAVVEQK